MDTVLENDQAKKLAFLKSVQDNFPIELRERDQWVVWKYVRRSGKEKPTKIPFNPMTYSCASSTEPATWGSFEQVCAAFTKYKYDGIGFVFSKNDPYVGIDFDNCIVEGEIDKAIFEYIRQLDSYSEKSPSQTGIHTIVRGVLPEGRRKKKQSGVEMYEQARFFTVTGEHIQDTPKNVMNRQEVLHSLHNQIFGKAQTAQKQEVSTRPRTRLANDITLLERMFSSKYGEEIKKLWDGDIDVYSGDESSADLALCNHLAYWTDRDPERIDRLFRQSGLMRDKWNRQDYRDATIAKAMEPLPKSAETQHFTFLCYDTFMQRPPKQWKIKNIIGERDLAIVFGMAGSGKTFVIIDLIYAACQGKDWVGRWTADKQWQGKFEITRPLTVAYCFGEGGAGLPERFRAAEQSYGKPLSYICFVDDVPQLYKGEEQSGINAFVRDYQAAQTAEETPPLDLLIIDTQANATLGADENSSTHMAEVIANAQRAIKILGCSVILIHHATKAGGTYRGSSVLHGAADCMIEVEKQGDNDFRIGCFKLKDGEQWESQRFSLLRHNGLESVYVAWDGVAAIYSKQKTKRQQNIGVIRQLLQNNPGKRFTTTGVETKTGIPTNTAKRVLSTLEKEKFAIFEIEQRGKRRIAKWYFDSEKSASS